MEKTNQTETIRKPNPLLSKIYNHNSSNISQKCDPNTDISNKTNKISELLIPNNVFLDKMILKIALFM